MRSDEFLDLLGDLEEEYVLEAQAAPKPGKAKRYGSALALAACTVLAVGLIAWKPWLSFSMGSAAPKGAGKEEMCAVEEQAAEVPAEAIDDSTAYGAPEAIPEPENSAQGDTEEEPIPPGSYLAHEPPELMIWLEDERGMGQLRSVRSANYSWFWPVSETDSGGVEACGLAPTDPQVQELSPELPVKSGQTGILQFVYYPWSITVLRWDRAALSAGDTEPADEPVIYQLNREPDGGKTGEFPFLTLEPNSVVEIRAQWQNLGDNSWGSASYYLVTGR